LGLRKEAISKDNFLLILEIKSIFSTVVCSVAEEPQNLKNLVANRKREKTKEKGKFSSTL